MKMKKTIGEKIKDLLDEKGYQAKDLADAVGVSQAAMSNYLTDKRDINIHLIGKIANFLNVSTDSLLLDLDVSNVKLSKKEEQLLKDFKSMSEEKQNAYLKIFSLENNKK